MDAETFSKLPDDVHRLIRNKLVGETVTEVQINFVLTQNNIDRKTFDDALEFIHRSFQRSSRIFMFIVVLLVFAASQLIFGLLF